VTNQRRGRPGLRRSPEQVHHPLAADVRERISLPCSRWWRTSPRAIVQVRWRTIAGRRWAAPPPRSPGGHHIRACSRSRQACICSRARSAWSDQGRL